MPDILSWEECQSWLCEAEPLPNVGLQTVKVGGLYNTVEDNEWADSLFSRIQLRLPEQVVYGWEACGINENFRILKYEPGEDFPMHQDPDYARPPGHELFGDVSLMTLIVYLNDNFTGGHTQFYGEEPHTLPHTDVKPVAGTAVVFMHKHNHLGTRIETGIKYTLRTDIMFRRTSPS